jgi:hypothetical protein
MPQEIRLPPLTEEEALRRIINWLRGSRRKAFNPVSSPDYGHELYIPNVIIECFHEVIEEDKRRNPVTGMRQYSMNLHQEETSPFYDAVWTLCRNGILRPDPPNPNSNGEDSGRGFTVTSYGKEWLSEVSGYECIPAEYGRFSQLLAGHSHRFGDGYHSRSQEAVSCYRAHTYLACCAMCGASAESIMLALAIAKNGSEEAVIREYKSANGRSKIENMIIGQQKDRIKQEFTNFTSLLKYWRDTAAHGARSTIGEEEAFTSMLILLRFARFADENWDELTT